MNGSENSPANQTFASINQRMSTGIPLIINKCRSSQRAFEGEKENVDANFVVFLPYLTLRFQLLWETENTDLKKSRSTVIRHLYGRVNQNKINQICKIKSKVKKNNNKKHTQGI